MTYFAILDGGRIASVITADEAPTEPHEVLAEWNGPPPNTVGGDRLVVVDGVAVWVDGRSLSEVKAAKNAEINAARLAANRSAFPFAGKLIASDELSRSDIDAVQGIVSRTQALPPGWPGAWKALDNTFVAVATVADWDALYAAMVAQGLANFAHSQALKAQLEAATTTAEVDSINWSTEA